MDTLEKFLKKIDESSFDRNDVGIINSKLQQISTQLVEEGKDDIAAIANLNRELFSVRKSFDYKEKPENGTIHGLSWQIHGTQTLDDGTEIPVYWPDVTKYTQQNFEYFEKRYNESKNLFIKTEYGLMVYFGRKTAFSRHNEFKQLLGNELFELGKYYLAKADKGDSERHNLTYSFHSLQLALGIVTEAKIEPESTKFIHFIYDIHQKWDINNESRLPALLELSGLLLEFFKYANQIIDFQLVLEKNLRGAEKIEKRDAWAAMSLIDRNIGIAQKRGHSVSTLLCHKAKLYERLAVEAELNRNLAAIDFTQKALHLYQQVKSINDVARLEKKYAELRDKFGLFEHKLELPAEYVENMNENISRNIENNDEKGILRLFISSPWYDTIQNVKNQSIESNKETVLLSMLPASITDKFGNTVDMFISETEKEAFNFWQTYSFNFQIGTQTMIHFFMEAYKAKKLNYESVLSYLEETWFNEAIDRSYHGQAVEVKPIDTLKPGLKRIFDELDRYFSDNSYPCDFVTPIDSLTLKIEGILRYICEKIGTPTFKAKQKGAHKLMMEKTLDDLLADVAHHPPLRPEQKTNFDEEDRVLIKYVLSEKVGLNLRNEVAHGLMDISEYSFDRVVIIFCIILKLSKYQFVKTKGGTDDDSHK